MSHPSWADKEVHVRDKKAITQAEDISRVVESSLNGGNPAWVSGSFPCGTVVSIGGMPSEQGVKDWFETLNCPNTYCPSGQSCKVKRVFLDENLKEAASSVKEAIGTELSNYPSVMYVNADLVLP